MPYIVERKVNGNIYRYEIESYWDKDKKQPRQRCKRTLPSARKNKEKYWRNLRSNSKHSDKKKFNSGS